MEQQQQQQQQEGGCAEETDKGLQKQEQDPQHEEQQQQQQQQDHQQQQDDTTPEPLQRLGNCRLLPSDGGRCVWECADFLGRPCVVKQVAQAAAVSRHPLLGRKQAKQPCQQDVAGMARVRRVGVPTPIPYHIDPQHSLLYCSKVNGLTLQQRLDQAQEVDAGVEQLLCELGRLLALMHDTGVVHGRLSSSSSVLVRDTDQAVLLQGFECFVNSTAPKDKAADLVLLEADLAQQHPQLPGLFDKVLAAYNKHNKQWSAVFNRLPEARQALQKHQGGSGPSSKKQKTKATQ